MRPIPTTVLKRAEWWASGKARLSRHPTMLADLPAGTVRADLGTAARWALYEWRHIWLEGELATAMAYVIGRVLASRTTRTRRKTRMRDADRRTGAKFNRLLRRNRAMLAAEPIDEIQMLADAIAPALAKTRARVAMARALETPRAQAGGVHVEGQWWTCIAAYQADVIARLRAKAAGECGCGGCGVTAPAERATVRAARSLIRSAIGAPSRSQRGVSLGQLSRLAAELNGRRL